MEVHSCDLEAGFIFMPRLKFTSLVGGESIGTAIYKYGTVNSGKSFEIYLVAHNYEEQGKRVLYTKLIAKRG